MSEYEKFFTTYTATTAPTIKSEGYQDVQTFYDLMTDKPATTKKVDDEDESFTMFLDVQSKPVWEYNPVQYNIPTPPWGNPIDRVILSARSQRGARYTFGGSSPNTGFDCSGLIDYAYNQIGINLPRTVKEMESYGQEVQLSNVQPGDIICLSSSGPSGKHAKLVTEVENGKIWTIEARGKNQGIVEDLLLDTSKITTIRRVTGKSGRHPIIDYFVSKGLTENLARSIYGNIMQESNGNIAAISKDGKSSYGLALWTGPRKQELFKRYGKNPTLQLQLDFMWWELNNTYKKVLDRLKRSTSIEDAVRIVMDGYESPNPAYANYLNRLKYAKS